MMMMMMKMMKNMMIMIMIMNTMMGGQPGPPRFSILQLLFDFGIILNSFNKLEKLKTNPYSLYFHLFNYFNN